MAISRSGQPVQQDLTGEFLGGAVLLQNKHVRRRDLLRRYQLGYCFISHLLPPSSLLPGQAAP